MERVYTMASKVAPMLKEIEKVNNEIATFYSRSPKRISHQKEYLETQGKKMFHFSHVYEVRWIGPLTNGMCNIYNFDDI